MLNSLKKPFNPNHPISKQELRATVKKYTSYMLKIKETPDIIKTRTNILREELGLYEDIDIEFMTRPGMTGVLVAKTIIAGLKLQESKKLVIQSIVSVLTEELEKMEHCEMMKRVRKK